MLANLEKNLFIFTILAILSLLNGIVYAESVEEIIQAQEELNTASKEKERAYQEKQRLSDEAKDAIAIGKAEYLRTCSICHGTSAKGNGIFAHELKVAPADLTLIKSNNNNVFPFSRLYQIIDGRNENTSHGARDMPIWGNRYNSENWLYGNTQNSETLVRGKIFELLLYLETIQQ